MDELILHPDTTDIFLSDEEEPIEGKQRGSHVTDVAAQETNEQREGKRGKGGKRSLWEQLGRKINDEKSVLYIKHADESNKRKRKLPNSYQVQDQDFRPSQKKKKSNDGFIINSVFSTERRAVEIANEADKEKCHII